MSSARLSLAPPSSSIAHRLAYAGLIPFALGALLVWLVREDALAYAALSLSAYAAAVVAMLGGIHWGLGFKQEPGRRAAPRPGDAPLGGAGAEGDGGPASLPSPVPFAWGAVAVVVSSIAVIMPPHAGLVIHGAMLIACYLVDRRVYPSHGLSHWLTLRFRLSAVAAFCCFLAAAGA